MHRGNASIHLAQIYTRKQIMFANAEKNDLTLHHPTHLGTAGLPLVKGFSARTSMVLPSLLTAVYTGDAAPWIFCAIEHEHSRLHI